VIYLPFRLKAVYLRTYKNTVFTSPCIGTAKFVVSLWEVSGIEVSQNYENCQGMEGLHKKQRMEMNQNEMKIVLECKGLEIGELKSDTSRIQWPRCLKLFCIGLLVYWDHWFESLCGHEIFLLLFGKSFTYVVLTKCWQLPIYFMVAKFNCK
jgi:hypothetical protein